MVTHYFQPPIKIAIVGLGPRGLSIFERLLSAAELLPDQYIDLAIFEPNKPGCGVHVVEQPGYLMLNTVAGQIGAYPDAAALSELPHGRGDWFERVPDGGCTYHASGKEPHILPRSRAGIPFRARPVIPKDRQRHRAVIFTPERLETLRARASEARLGFESDILPLLRLERWAAALSVCMAQGDSAQGATALSEMAEIAASIDSGCAVLECHLLEKEERLGAFDCAVLLEQSLPEDLDDAAYQVWVAPEAVKDLEAVCVGILASPVKAAAGVWRDLRDMSRSTVDFGGLTSASHRQFYQIWAGKINRLVAVPQKERCEDLLDLIEVGIVELKHPCSKVDDHLSVLCAWVPFAGLCGVTAGIFADLEALGKIRAVVTSPGLDGVEVNADCNAISREGAPVQDLWVLGPATEGSSYYNHYIATPHAPNRAFTDAARVAAACLVPIDPEGVRRSA